MEFMNIKELVQSNVVKAWVISESENEVLTTMPVLIIREYGMDYSILKHEDVETVVTIDGDYCELSNNFFEGDLFIPFDRNNPSKIWEFVDYGDKIKLTNTYSSQELSFLAYDIHSKKIYAIDESGNVLTFNHTQVKIDWFN